MSRLLETIHIKDGKNCNLSFHNKRLNQARKELFLQTDEIDLDDYIHVPSHLYKGSIKCRVLYTKVIERIEYQPYTPRAIKSLKLIHNDHISYRFKSENRNELTELYNQRGSSDDILIVKNGLLTDSYHCNIALLKEGVWFTPKEPLLQGTKREELLAMDNIREAHIHVDSIHEYKSIRLFNAMLSFGQIELPTSAIG